MPGPRAVEQPVEHARARLADRAASDLRTGTSAGHAYNSRQWARLKTTGRRTEYARGMGSGDDRYVRAGRADRAGSRPHCGGLEAETRDQRIEVEGGLAVDFARRAVHRDGREVHRAA